MSKTNKLTLSLLLITCGLLLAQQQNTNYTTLQFDSGVAAAKPLQCSIPGFFWATDTSALYTCTKASANASPAYNTSVGGGGTTTIAHSIATMATGAISANTCASAVVVSATGVLSTDSVVATANADISAVVGYGVLSTDGLKVYVYPTANNVNFKVCNPTGTSVTPGSAVVFNFSVYR